MAMASIHTLAILGVALALGGCGAGPSGHTAMVAPGSNRTAADFQQDVAVCQQHAAAQTGYGAPVTPAPVSQAGAPTGPAAAPAQPTDDVSFMQCMAARGNTIQVVAAANPYPAPYAYGYPGPGFYPYAYGGSGFAFGGPGFFHGRNFHHDFHSGPFHHGGF